jgi:hypothetical protein
MTTICPLIGCIYLYLMIAIAAMDRKYGASDYLNPLFISMEDVRPKLLSSTLVDQRNFNWRHSYEQITIDLALAN